MHARRRWVRHVSRRGFSEPVGFNDVDIGFYKFEGRRAAYNIHPSEAVR